METTMRIALITGVLLLALATSSLAETRVSYGRDSRSDSSFDFELSLGDPFYDPFELGSANDRGGFRVFIPRGQQGREYYQTSTSGYRGGRPGRVRGGGHGSYYRRGDYDGSVTRRRYWRP